jgi:hypothetical protein
MIEKSGQPPSKKVIDSWLTNAKLVMASEDLDGIVNLTHAMRTSDKGEVLKIMQHLVAHKAPARQYAMLRTGDKYTEDLGMQDFKEIRSESYSQEL